ncbi:glycoside hydrolase family 18 protein [Sunxiuqinia elliptica]|uniref:chitinase n=1 Tax=Sunxiuqinia elliptica TaxID=655355 RepID=A0A1I2G7U4_9BACT|nr:glycoside hydrolase family 18 protein [Sunxiuqinia elliptica]SFF13213.1 Chitinase, GH18 family [Sunxiuqinia elliptica]
MNSINILLRVLIIFCSFLLSSCDRESVVLEEPDNNTDNDDTSYEKFFSSYIRLNFYETGRVSDESVLAYDDLIMIAFRPYTDGTLFFDLPDNQASFSNASYLKDFDNRNGVIDFNGTDADMNVGFDLLNNVKIAGGSDGSYKQFTFGTWLSLDNWTPGGFIFKKANESGSVYCKMSDAVGVFEFNINGKSVTIHADNVLNGWHHFALGYNGNKGTAERVACYIDGTLLDNVVVASDFPSSVPFIREAFHIGSGIDAKLDETFISSLFLPAGTVSGYMNNGIKLRKTDWNSSKTLAYWTYDNSSDPGKDAQSWRTIYDELRTTLTGKDIKLRVGMAGGDWKTVVGNATSRTTFVNSVSDFISQYAWDGVDLDFEWCESTQEYNNYSKAIVELGEKLATSDVTYSVSLHAYYYKISQLAINKTDFISLQVYGPQPSLFDYDEFVSKSNAVVDYGIPKEKLVLGVPFYGVESNGNRSSAAYLNFVDAGLISSPLQDQVTYNGKTYTFDGQETIRKKALFAKQNKYKGIMSWDIATDVTYSNELSLAKAVNDVLAFE